MNHNLGEASYLLGGHPMSDYAFMHESQVPKLLVIKHDDIEIERASEKVYISLERESAKSKPPTPLHSPCHSSSSLLVPPPSPILTPRKPSLTTKSLGSLAAASPIQFTNYSTFIERCFSVDVESIQVASDSFYHCLTNSSSTSKLGIQAGLFHGGKLLCRIETAMLKTPSMADEFRDGMLTLNVHITFDIKVLNLPRNTKLCLGLFERKKPNAPMHPISWVNMHVFDYQAKLRKRDTLHTWNYFLGNVMPTFEMLNPLR